MTILLLQYAEHLQPHGAARREGAHETGPDEVAPVVGVPILGLTRGVTLGPREPRLAPGARCGV